MYCGMSFIIHDKDSYIANKEKIKELLALQNMEEENICNAATIEYKGNLFLIIDGYSSLLDWKEPNKELKMLKEIHEELCADTEDENIEFIDRRFLHNFLLLTYPAYAENPKFFYDAYTEMHSAETLRDCMNYPVINEELRGQIQKKLSQGKSTLTRENICFGLLYSESNNYTSVMFDTEIDKIDTLSDDIFKASSEQIDVNEVKFIETLYDSMEE